MPQIPFYAYYKPQYTEYKPKDLSSLYAKYAELQSKNSKKKDIKLPEFKELEGVGLSNENRLVAEKMIGIRSEMDHLANIGDTESMLMIQDLTSQYRRLAIEIQTNKNNKEAWDKASEVLKTQEGNNVLVLDKNSGFLTEVTEIDPETKEVKSSSYTYITPKERVELDAKIKERVKKLEEDLAAKSKDPNHVVGKEPLTTYNILTYGKLKEKLNNDDRLVRQPGLIEKLTNGMDLNYINKQYISPVLDKVKTTKIGSKSTVGGFQNAAGEVISESMRGGTTEENFQQLKAATQEIMNNLEAAGGGKPWESLLSYAYQMPAKEWVTINKKKVLREKQDANGNPVFPTTEAEARLNIELYVLGASDKAKEFSQETESTEKIDFRTTFNLKNFGNAEGTSAKISPILVEATSLNKNGKLTFVDLSKGGTMKYATLSTDVPVTQEELKKNKGFLSDLKFLPGLVDKAQLETGRRVKGSKVIIEDGDPNADIGYDYDITKNLAKTILIDGKVLKLTQIYVDKTGKKATFENLTKEQKNLYYNRVHKNMPKEEKAKKLTEVFKELGFKADLVYFTTGIAHKKSLNYTDKITWDNSKKSTRYSTLLLDEKVESDEIKDYVTRFGGGDYDAGKKLLDDDVSPKDFGRIAIYIPFNSIGANAAGSQPGSWNYKANDHLGNIINFSGTNTFK